MKYRLINRNIADMVDDETFSEHRMIFKADSAMKITKFVEDHKKLKTGDLSVITKVRGVSLTIYSFNSWKWVK